jgi:hypothetical protein
VTTTLGESEAEYEADPNVTGPVGFAAATLALITGIVLLGSLYVDYVSTSDSHLASADGGLVATLWVTALVMAIGAVVAFVGVAAGAPPAGAAAATWAGLHLFFFRVVDQGMEEGSTYGPGFWMGTMAAVAGVGSAICVVSLLVNSSRATERRPPVAISAVGVVGVTVFVVGTLLPKSGATIFDNPTDIWIAQLVFLAIIFVLVIGGFVARSRQGALFTLGALVLPGGLVIASIQSSDEGLASGNGSNAVSLIGLILAATAATTAFFTASRATAESVPAEQTWAPPTPAPAPAVRSQAVWQAPSIQRSAADRLRDLDDLRARGLIAESEYVDARQRILGDL